MKEISSCESFEKLLDRQAAGDLTPEETHWLSQHARQCADCAMLLRIRDHLAAPSTEVLAEDLPADADARMWHAVAAQTRTPAAAGRRSAPWWQAANPQRWLAPVFATALLLLLIGNLLLIGELRRIHHREQELASQLAQIENRLPVAGQPAEIATLAGGFTAGRRPGILAAATRGARSRIDVSIGRWLPDRESLTASELRAELSQIPPRITLLSRYDAELLLEHLAARSPLGIGALLKHVQIEDGLQTEEVLRLLDQLLPDAEQSISREQLRRAVRRLDRGIAL